MKIIDFGLSQRLVKGKELKTLCGTAEFVAPEVKIIILKSKYYILRIAICILQPNDKFQFFFFGRLSIMTRLGASPIVGLLVSLRTCYCQACRRFSETMIQRHMQIS